MPNAAAKKPFPLKSGNTFRIEIDGFFETPKRIFRQDGRIKRIHRNSLRVSDVAQNVGSL
jgi:hypothetical protein